MLSRFKILLVALFLFFLIPNSFVYTQTEISRESRRISADDFLKDDAMRYFKSGQYESAILAFDALEKSYPDDPLILRYRAMVFDRLGDADKAIDIYRKLLSASPDHVPTHFFLAQSLARSGEYQAAIKEWNYVVHFGPGTPYAEGAQNALRQFGKLSEFEKKPDAIKRWLFKFFYGYSYDKNVALDPDDKDLPVVTDRSAGSHSVDFNMRYRLVSKLETAVDLIYSDGHSFYDDHLNKFNYHSDIWGAAIQHVKKWGEKDIVWRARYDQILDFLGENQYSSTSRIYLSAITEITKRVQLLVYNQTEIANYGDDGSEPTVLSRDGFKNDFGIANYFFSEDYKSHIFINTALGNDVARGSNLDSTSYSVKTGFHAVIPNFDRWAIDFSAGVEHSFYHSFRSRSLLDESRRRGFQWDFEAALEYAWTPNFLVRSFYRYVSHENQNNLFEYTRQLMGIQLEYQLAA